MAVHEVVDVVAMRDHLMSTTHAVDMVLLMRSTFVTRRTIFWVRLANFNLMVVYVIAMSVVHVAIVKVISMTVVFNSSVAALRTVLVAMRTRMLPVSLGHRLSPS